MLKSIGAMRAGLSGVGSIGMLAGFAALLVGAGIARAQCPPSWLVGDGQRGVDGVVYSSIMWDPDAAGPKTPLLVLAGNFTRAGNAQARNIATYDPATAQWGSLADGVGQNDLIYELVIMPNNDLVAVGGFTIASGTAANSVARWNGTSWAALGNGITGGFVTAATVMNNGDLVVGGNFNTAGTTPANNIARWDGAAWHAMGAGITAISSKQVWALTTLTNGDVIAGGLFDFAGGAAARNLARWTPSTSTWSAFGTGVDSQVVCLAAVSGDGFVAGGSFASINGTAVRGVARYSPAGGGTWSGYGTGTGGVIDVRPMPSGELYVGGSMFEAGGTTVQNIAKWTPSGGGGGGGGSWSSLGNGVDSSVWTITVMPGGNIAAGGYFENIDGLRTRGIAIWNGSAWQSWPGFDSSILGLAELTNGDVIAGGYFSTAGLGHANFVARRRAGEWQPIGSGVDGRVNAVVAMPSGVAIIGGAFATGGGESISNIATIGPDGAWSDVGGGMDGEVNALLRSSNGDVIAGGSFSSPGSYVARWDGANWSALGDGPGGTVLALAEMPNGDVIAGGDFATDSGGVGNRIARWDGSAWSALGDGFNDSVNALAVLPNGDLIAAGWFDVSGATSVSRIARWDGAAWQPLDTGLNTYANALAVLADGQLVVGGAFYLAGSEYSVGIASWDGAAWHQFSGGIGGTVNALALSSTGGLYVGGNFAGAGSAATAQFAQWQNTGVRITAQPQAASNCPTGTATFHVEATGYGNLYYQWYKGSDPIDSGANATAVTDTLVIASATLDDSAFYSCDVFNDCSTVRSDYAPLLYSSCCPADFNADGFLTFEDFDAFVGAFEAGEPAADFDADGFLTFEDFDAFVGAFEAGC